MTRPGILFSLVLLVLAAASPAVAGDAQAAFESIKALEGTWTGPSPEEGMEGELKHVFKVSANDSVVMETMNPDTPHEMINMYHLDGDNLVLTHYCAAGNQPTMKLAGMDDGEMKFEFSGGTNLDPAKDHHIHAGALKIDGDTIHSTWIGWSEGKEQGTMVFVLTRQ